MSEGMISGRVKSYNARKGFGFVVPVDGGADVFVHATTLHAVGQSALHVGQVVRFTRIETPKGFKAADINVGNCPHCGGTGMAKEDVA